MVAAVILAAGASARMGRSKTLLPLGTGTVLSTVIERLLRAPVDRLVLVLGHDAEAVRRDAARCEDPRLAFALNESWPTGMASSLRTGIEACADAACVVLALADQPDVEPEVVRRLVAAWRAGATLAVPVHAGRSSHPVLFDRRLFGELLALSGDVGARSVVTRHWAEAARIDASALRDIDTPADYEALLAGLPPSDPEGFEVPKDRRG